MPDAPVQLTTSVARGVPMEWITIAMTQVTQPNEQNILRAVFSDAQMPAAFTSNQK